MESTSPKIGFTLGAHDLVSVCFSQFILLNYSRSFTPSKQNYRRSAVCHLARLVYNARAHLHALNVLFFVMSLECLL